MNSLIVMLLDKSDSMGYQSAWPHNVAAFNQFLSYQQMRNDDCEMYVAFFNENFLPVYEFVPVYDVPKLDATKIRQDGGTMLKGAIRKTLHAVKSHIDGLPPQERPPNVTVVIQTDGEDAAPNYYGDDKILEKTIDDIKARMKDGWQFIWLGACNGRSSEPFEKQAPVKEARSLKIPKERIVAYDKVADPEQTFSELGRRLLEATVTGHFEQLDGLDDDEDEEDV